MSKAVAIVGSTILGTTTGEHHNHFDEFNNPIHNSGTLTGVVTQGSEKLQINGINVAIELSPTIEYDNCGNGSGTLGIVQHKLKINGKSVQLIGDATIPHNGVANIASGDQKIIVG